MKSDFAKVGCFFHKIFKTFLQFLPDFDTFRVFSILYGISRHYVLFPVFCDFPEDTHNVSKSIVDISTLHLSGASHQRCEELVSC